MSQDLLEKILKNEFNSNLDELVKFLMLFKKNDFIYPSTIKNKFKFNNKKIYTLFTILEKEKIVKIYYEIYCYTCSKSIKIYENFSQIEESLFCDYCETSIFNENNIKVVYKVVK